jgi:CHAD domain-containing protein
VPHLSAEMAETGAQYVLPDGLGAAAAGEALAAELRLERGSSRSAERTFYDTFDGRLHAAGLALVHGDGRLALVDAVGYEERAGADHAEPPDRVLAIEMDAGPLREALLPLVDMRALTPIARIRSRLRPLRVLNDDAKTVVRMVVEAPVVANGRRLRPRLHVAPVRGYGDELADVRRRLENGLGVLVADLPLHEDAVAAAGGTPGGVSSKPAFSLRAEQPAAAAAAVMFADLLRVIEANVPGTLADVDSEFLHDLRVAVRRTRSLQRQLSSELPPELARFRTEFRRLQQVTGAARDLDVYLLDFASFRATAGPDLDPLRGLLEHQRKREHARMARALRSARTRRLLTDWAAFLAGLEGGRPIGDAASERIGKVYRRMVKAGRAIDDTSEPEALHDLRKQGKELRYLLEFFASLYPDKVVRPMVKALKALQDTLGRYQDREVQASTLRAMREDVVGLDDGAAALMAMGLLVEHLERDQAAARAEFAERFGAFAAKEQRAQVRKTFA